VVGYYGTVAGRGDLGVLGHGAPAAQTAALEAAAAPFAAAGGRPVLPTLELITTVAQGAPGADGTYSKQLSDADVQAYLDAARAAKAYLVLDLQPGTARFVDQARRYERFLREPDVGLGLDPEWKLQPGQLPRKQIGHTDAAEVNEVGAYLQQLVEQGNLPQKLFVLHQFRASMIPDRAAVVRQPGLATVIHVDGFGGQAIKRQVYATLSLKAGEFFNGFKLFYDEDTAMLTPAEVMALVPRPDLVTYQ
jgi:DNA-binding phage protein